MRATAVSCACQAGHSIKSNPNQISSDQLRCDAMRCDAMQLAVEGWHDAAQLRLGPVHVLPHLQRPRRVDRLVQLGRGFAGLAGVQPLGKRLAPQQPRLVHEQHRADAGEEG
mmetsp:Transcript_100422/g.279718  ORF Transcript_100422/g.279718 Transcript_100422/m.279718 type:complete len:112 (+) Transcript_100422:40-375(+)